MMVVAVERRKEEVIDIRRRWSECIVGPDLGLRRSFPRTRTGVFHAGEGPEGLVTKGAGSSWQEDKTRFDCNSPFPGCRRFKPVRYGRIHWYPPFDGTKKIKGIIY